MGMMLGSPALYGDDPRVVGLPPLEPPPDQSLPFPLPPLPAPMVPHLSVPPSHPVLQALAAILSQAPAFAPQRDAFGKYPGVLSRLAGVALPLLAHGVGAGLQAPMERERAVAEAGNRAELERADAQNRALAQGYGSSILGRYRLANTEASGASKQTTVTPEMERQSGGLVHAGETVPASLAQSIIGGLFGERGRKITADATRDAAVARAGATVDAARTRASAGGGSPGGGGGDAELIAEAIATGKQPPVTTGLYRFAGPVRASLARRGYDLTKAQADYTAVTKWLASANGSQQLRMRQAAETAYGSLDVIDQLSDRLSSLMPRGRVRVLNRVALGLAKNGTFGAEAQAVATQLDAQIGDVVSELGNVYMGGNSPTDHALTLAARNLSSDWAKDQLRAATKLARVNLRIRLNSIGTAGPVSPSNPVTDQPVTGIQVGDRTVPVAPPRTGAEVLVPMLDPKGRRRLVPESMVDEALRHGGRRAP